MNPKLEVMADCNVHFFIMFVHIRTLTNTNSVPFIPPCASCFLIQSRRNCFSPDESKIIPILPQRFHKGIIIGKFVTILDPVRNTAVF